MVGRSDGSVDALRQGHTSILGFPMVRGK
jgi:hypothetical protein